MKTSCSPQKEETNPHNKALKKIWCKKVFLEKNTLTRYSILSVTTSSGSNSDPDSAKLSCRNRNTEQSKNVGCF